MMIDLFLNLSLILLSLKLTAKSQKPIAISAEVVKLANTLRSGRSGRKLLRVQLPPSAFPSYKLDKMTWVSAIGRPTSGGQLPPSAVPSYELEKTTWVSAIGRPTSGGQLPPSANQ